MVCSPIFAEIVPVKSRTSIYALDRSFESILASFAPPAVGFLSQHVYGFRLADAGKKSKSSTVERDRENAASLAKALYTAIAIPMTICALIYGFLYRTYPRDRERARMQSLIQSELQDMELEEDAGGDERFELFESGADDDGDVGTEKLLANRDS